MTVEMAEYHRAMLQMGLGDQFYKAFDKMLEEEDPLSELTLLLCDCISDVNAVLHILGEYTLAKTVDEQAVRDLILNDIRIRFEAGQMSRRDVIATLYDIACGMNKPWEDPWLYFYMMSKVTDLYEEGFISEEVFHKDFDIWWSAEDRDVSKISAQWLEQNHPPKKKNFFSRIRMIFKNPWNN